MVDHTSPDQNEPERDKNHRSQDERIDLSNMGIIRWFANNHVAANLLMIFLIAGGIFALVNMRAETFPSVDPRLITVTVPFPGATPFEVEDGITSRVEEALVGLDGVKRVTSAADEGMGSIQVELEEFANANDVRNDVETEIDRLADFPPEDAEDPVIVKQKPRPGVITLVLYGKTSEAVVKRWAERIESGLLREGAASLVDIQGGRDYQISIELSEQKLRKHGLSLDQVSRIIGAFSRNIPAGTVETKSGDILLRVEEKGEFGSEFSDIVVSSNPDGSILRLSDVATIKDGFEDSNLISLYNGLPALYIQISRSEAQDTLEVEKNVMNYLNNLELPAGLNIDIWESETENLKDRMNLLLRNGILGFALVFLILLLFLDLKLAFWTSFAIPISFLGGLLCVYFMGYSINMVTLFALIIVLGIVVDDAIVTGESIFTTQRQGYKDTHAAMIGVRRIMAPVTISVLTTVAAFLPLAFVTGTLGQILRVIPPVVISILLISLLEAYFILPAHLRKSSRWSAGALRALGKKFTNGLHWFIDMILTPTLQLCLKFRYVSLSLFIGILILSFGVIQSGIIKFVFFPQIEGDEVTINLTMPVGTSFDVTRDYAMDILDAAKKVREEINAQRENQPDIYKATSLTVGKIINRSSPVNAGGETASNNAAQVRIKLIESNKREISTLEIENKIRQTLGNIPGADELSYESSLVRDGADINIELSYHDKDILERAANRLKKRMKEMNGVIEVASSLKPGKREFIFEIRPAGLASGLTPAALGNQLRNSFFGFEVQRIQRSRTELKVMVRYPADGRDKLEYIHNMRVVLPDGSKAPLETMVRIREEKSFATIQRADGQRIASVTADVDTSVITPNEAIPIIFDTILPDIKRDYPDIGASLQGESRDRQEDLKSLGRNMIVAVMIIFVILGALLKSYAQPFIVMMIIPFGIIGAVIGHYLLGFNLSFISLFGIVALTGVIVNASVVMIDYYNMLKEKGERTYEALIDAVQRRFRPILLTTLTTSAGLLPILTETSLQARFLIPMAISLAFGLIFGTLILLFLVPTLIAILEDMRRLRPGARKADLSALEHSKT